MNTTPSLTTYSSPFTNETEYWSLEFDCSDTWGCGFLYVESIDETDPPRDIAVWLPDPTSPLDTSLVGHVWHPVILDRLADSDWSYNRFMDLQETNRNNQVDWNDRRLPRHASQSGTLNPRNVQDPTSTPDPGVTGMSIEHVAHMANTAELDAWICVPHMATDDYVTNLALSLRWGTNYDGMPGTEESPGQIQGLADDRKVYVEYSNEIWAGGHEFPQGDWADDQASLLNMTTPTFIAQRAVDIWAIFREVFAGEEDRVVHVAAVWTAREEYTGPFLEEMARYGDASFIPPIVADIVAGTTYFGNNIQYYADRRAREEADSPENRWYYLPNLTTVSIDDAYWDNSPELQGQMEESLDVLLRRMLGDSTTDSVGRDQVGIGGGFDVWLKELADNTFAHPVPLVSYEGSFYLYTDRIDHGSLDDDGPTIFMEALNRHPRLETIQATHLNVARAKGLMTHGAFTMVGAWGKYGCGAHLEYLDQQPHESPKYRNLLSLNTEFKHMAHPDDPTDTVPVFGVNSTLPVANYLEYYSAIIDVTCPNSTWCLAESIASILTEGLQAVWLSPTSLNIRGIPLKDDPSYVFLRAVDDDIDPSWKTFGVHISGAGGILFECDFTYEEGVEPDPARNQPWRETKMLSPSVDITGWNFGGPGLNLNWGEAVSEGFAFSVSVAGGGAADSNLTYALENDHYLTINVTAVGDFQLNLAEARALFTVQRRDYWSPVSYALFSSIGGFNNTEDAIYIAPTVHHGDTRSYTYSAYLPSDPAYDIPTGTNSSVEFRLYCYGARWGGHVTTLTEFKLSSRFQWTLPSNDTDSCTVPCGGGTANRTLECRESSTGEVDVFETSCPYPRPPNEVQCNTHPCGSFTRTNCDIGDLPPAGLEEWECQGFPPLWCVLSGSTLERVVATCDVTDGSWQISDPSSAPSTLPSGAPTQESSSEPSESPSAIPSESPSVVPSIGPSSFPSSFPSGTPTQPPSVEPSLFPSLYPSLLPSSSPSSSPSAVPSSGPSLLPSGAPTHHPSSDPSSHPSTRPSLFPSSSPTYFPSSAPSPLPSGSPSSLPSVYPSLLPSSSPSSSPSAAPSFGPSLLPSGAPTHHPSSDPSSHPSTSPSVFPSASPTYFPSSAPSPLPSRFPSSNPSSYPSYQPTYSPSEYPSSIPTSSPSADPCSECLELFEDFIDPDDPKASEKKCKKIIINKEMQKTCKKVVKEVLKGEKEKKEICLTYGWCFLPTPKPTSNPSPPTKSSSAPTQTTSNPTSNPTNVPMDQPTLGPTKKKPKEKDCSLCLEFLKKYLDPSDPKASEKKCKDKKIISDKKVQKSCKEVVKDVLKGADKKESCNMYGLCV